MYLRRRGQRRGRGCTGGAVSGDRRSRLLVESLEPRRLLTANDGGLVSEDAGNYDQSDIHEPQIVVAQGDMFAPVATVQSGSDIVSFYGYNTENTHSSNTGYEASGYVTFVVHEDDYGDVGLVILVDAPHDEGGGAVNFDIDGLDSATIVVEDEPNEQTPSSGESLFSRSWNAQANDGAAYSNLGYYFSITVDPNYLFGIDGFQVVDGADDSTVQIPLADEEFEIYAEYGLEISAVPSVVLEAEGTLSATITRGGATDQDLLVSLQTSHTDRVSLPETVLIPAGASSADFAVELVDNSLPYDAFTMTVTASAERFRDSQVVLNVVDDDLPLLDVGIELTSYDANGLDFSSGYLVTGTTINHVVSVTNIQQIAISSPTVFFDGQTANDSSDDVMFTPHRNANDANVGDLNNNLLFDPGEVWQFSLEDVVGSGQNVGRVYCGAVYPTLDIALSASVSAGYFGVSPALAINLDSANPGENLLVLAGESVTTHYALSNTGNTGLTDVVVDGATYVSGDTNADTILDVGEVWSYAHTGEAIAGAHSLSAAVTARDALTDTGVSGTASGSYFGAVVGVAVDQTLDSAYVLSGGSVAANYALSNTGNTGLTDVVVDGATYVSGDTNADTILDVGEVWSYAHTGEAIAGAHSLSAAVTARDALTDTGVSGTASGSYFGAVVGVAVDQTLDSAYVLSGGSVAANYALSNTGNTGLTDVVVDGATYVSGDTNADTILDVGEVWSYAHTGEAIAGAHSLSAAVTARDALTDTGVSGTASGSYFGAVVGVAVDQTLDSAYVLSGGSVAANYALSNTGNTGLTDVVVDGATYVSGDTNADTILDVGEVWSYAHTGEAIAGAHSLSAAVTARDALTDTGVSGTASGSYFGAVVDWAATSTWDGELEGNMPELIVGESFRIAYHLENLGDVELTGVSVAGADPVFAGQFVEGDLDEDGRIDPQEIWKYEYTGIVTLGDYSRDVDVETNSADFDVTLITSIQNDYHGYYRSLAVTHTGDSGIGSLRYVLEDAASRPEGGVIFFDLSQDDPGFVDIDSHLPQGDAEADIFIIQPLSALPPLQGAGPIEIIGGVDGVPVVIDGSLAGASHGLEILSDGNQVRGLTIQNFEFAGIHIVGTGNTIAANKIGVDSAGQQAGNGGDGIWVEGGSQNLIGGQDEEGLDQNIIAYNGGNGISVEVGTINQINTNAFYENVGMGIDLGRNGFTPNDIEDGSVDEDTGANELINTPVITRIELVGSTVQIDYSVPTNTDAVEESLRIEFYRADESRREGGEFLGTDLYTPEDFQNGGKTLTVEIDEYPDLAARIVATATSASAGTSEFSAPRGIRFAGRAIEEEQQDLADDVANGILAQLEAYLSGQWTTPAPTPVPGGPIIRPDVPIHDFVVNDVTIEEILIGRNVRAVDETDCVLDVGSSSDPLIAVGFGEEVDDVTRAVNDYCVEQVYDLSDDLELTPGQMVAVIWFDPINFTVTIGDNQVSYDYDNNPTELVGSIPGASLVVTPASASTPGGVQGIMFAGDASTINVQMNTTNSGELMRGGVNIYTVGTGAGGTTIQPSIRTVFQGYLPAESMLMTFDPSAAPSLLVGGGPGSSNSQSVAQISASDAGGGGGGGIPMSIPGIFSGQGGFELAFLDPASMANGGLDISGSKVEEGENESEEENLQDQVQEEYGEPLEASEGEGEDEEELEERDEGDEEVEDLDESSPGDDEEEVEEAISAIFDLLGGAMVSTSGRIDVMEILTQEQATAGSVGRASDVGESSYDHAAVPINYDNEYEQRMSDHWATSYEGREHDKIWADKFAIEPKAG